MEFHEVASIFPMMDSPALAALTADITANGLREPVWTQDGKIIDGRNRWQACEAAGIIPPTREWDGKGSLVTFVVALNLHRRHLTSSQRAAIAADLEPLLAAEAKERQRAHGGTAPGRGKVTPLGGPVGPQAVPEITPGTIAGSVPPPERLSAPLADKLNETGDANTEPPDEPAGEAREQAAKLTGASPRYVSEAKALKQAAPELHEQVRRGEITLPSARRAQRAADAPTDTPQPPLRTPGMEVIVGFRATLRTFAADLLKASAEWNPVKRREATRRLGEIRVDLTHLIMRIDDPAGAEKEFARRGARATA